MPRLSVQSDVDGHIAGIRKELGPHLGLKNDAGSAARIMHAVMPAIMQWRADEFDRGLSFTDTHIAMTRLLASVLLSEAATYAENTNAPMIVALNNLNKRVTEMAQDRLQTGQPADFGGRVRSTDGGRG